MITDVSFLAKAVFVQLWKAAIIKNCHLQLRIKQISFDHSLKRGKPGRDFYNNNTYCLAMQTFFSINTASYH